MRISDEKLIKRAYYGGRNLLVLGVLSALAAIAITWAVPYLGREQTLFVTLAVGFAMLAMTYWILAAAAYRGDHRAVGTVVAVWAVSFVVGIVQTLVLPLPQPEGPPVFMVGWLIALLVMLSLLHSYRVLVELRRRGLWDQVFVPCTLSGPLCLIGGTLLVITMLSFFGYGIHVTLRVQSLVMAEQKAQAFVAMLETDEPPVMEAFRALSARDPDTLDTALERLGALDRKVKALKAQCEGVEPLDTVLTTYRRALDEWRKGLTEFQKANVDLAKAQRLLTHGDQLRTDAIRIFNARHAKP